MRIPREEDQEQLLEVDPDVEPVDLRQRDLRLPDGVWWAACLLVGFALGAAVQWQLLSHGAGAVPARLAVLAVGGAALTFAAERWGHRRYRMRRAARDAALVLAGGAAVTVLTLLWQQLAG